MLAVILAHVTHLKSEEELTHFLGENDNAFIKFYMPSCKHCQHVAPRFYDLSDMVAKVRLAEFNCQGNSAVCNKYSVNGVPSLQLFRGGQLVGKYENQWRDPKPMLKWLKENDAE